MRVLLLNQVFYPDVAATAQHAHDLARHLTAQGHEVVAVASRSMYGEKGGSLPKRETVDGIEIHRVGKSLFGKAGIVARLVDFLLFYVAATIRVFTMKRPDVVVCFTTPPFIALVGWLVRLLRGSRYVYWLMDMYPDIAVACGVMKEKGLLTRFFEGLNRFCLRKADAVVVLGRCMQDRVLGKGIDGSKVRHIGVWSDQDEVKPIERMANPYRAEWELGDRVAVMYSGNFGLGHDVETMCEAAAALADDDRIRFVFVGGGKKKATVEDFVRSRGLKNVVLAPYQPREKLDQSLSCADVHLASMIPGAEGTIVPCKLFGIMAAGRPAVFIGHPASELARVIEEHECGAVIEPGDVDGLVSLIRELTDDIEKRERLGSNARGALSAAYSRERACEQWRELLEAVVARAPLPGG